MKTVGVLLSADGVPPQLVTHAVEFDNGAIAFAGISEFGATISFKGMDFFLETLTMSGAITITAIPYPLDSYRIIKDEELVSEVVVFPTGVVVEHWVKNNTFITFENLNVLKEYIGEFYTLEKV